MANTNRAGNPFIVIRDSEFYDEFDDYRPDQTLEVSSSVFSLVEKLNFWGTYGYSARLVVPDES